jgi:hypothetical protein
MFIVITFLVITLIVGIFRWCRFRYLLVIMVIVVAFLVITWW